jgi:hypothetical protein
MFLRVVSTTREIFARVCPPTRVESVAGSGNSQGVLENPRGFIRSSSRWMTLSASVSLVRDRWALPPILRVRIPSARI